jgi:hypothetical protein
MSLTVTAADLRRLLNGVSDTPVLYVERDEDTGTPLRLDVWDEAYAPHHDIVTRKHELEDALGDASDDEGDDFTDLLPEYQATIDNILKG